jgi:hypothetical protein
MKFKRLSNTTPINPLPKAEEIVALIKRLTINDGEELEGSNALIRRTKTRGYNIALADVLEAIEEHRFGIKDIRTTEEL